MAPDRAVVLERSRLVQIRIPSGSSVDELDPALGSAGLGEGAGSLTYSRPRDSVLFSRVVTAARQEVVEVPLDGSPAEAVGLGHSVSPAPDGERFAVGRRELGEQGPDLEVLEIRTFEGRVVGRWVDPVRPEEPVSISHLSWSPDGRRVAFQLRLEDGTETRILDTAAEDGSLQGVSQKVDPVGDLRMLSAPEFRPGDGALLAVDGPGLDPDARQRWRIVALTPAGDVEEVLAETERAVTHLDVDDTGLHLLYVLGHAHRSGADQPAGSPELMYVQDGASVEVRQEVADVAW